jgi:hypothetical protein
VKSVNGFALGDVDKALEVYERAKIAKSVTLEIERRAKPMTLTYRIK